MDGGRRLKWHTSCTGERFKYSLPHAWLESNVGMNVCRLQGVHQVDLPDIGCLQDMLDIGCLQDMLADIVCLQDMLAR